MDFRTIFNLAMDLDDEYEITDYLSIEFEGKKDLFCEFIGLCSAELKDTAVKAKRRKMVDLMTAIAMVSLRQGRAEALAEANRIHYPRAVGA